MIRLFVLLCFLLTVAINTMASVWPQRTDTQAEWNDDWELKYSQWVMESVTDQWLQNPTSPFYLWKVDCAKFVYLTRLYFSYVNGLELRYFRKLWIGDKRRVAA